MMNLYDLAGKYKWETFIMRLGQSVVFDLHDGGSGLVFGKARVLYEDIVRSPRDPQGMTIMYLEFHIANEYGGGKTGGVLRLHVDLSVNVYVRPPKAPEVK